MNGPSSQILLVTLMSVLSLLAILVPLWRGLALALRARRATRWVPRAALEKTLQYGPKDPGDSLALLMLRVLTKSLRSKEAREVSSDFVVDATKQFVVHEYESNYARPIGMYANLLPPVGLTGNAVGMLVLMVSKHIQGTPLELGALGLALISTIFALLGYALLEALRLRIYGRLLRCLDEVVGLHRAFEERQERNERSGTPSRAAPAPA